MPVFWHLQTTTSYHAPSSFLAAPCNSSDYVSLIVPALWRGKKKQEIWCVSSKPECSGQKGVQRCGLWPLPPDSSSSAHPAEIITITNNSSGNLLQVGVLLALLWQRITHLFIWRRKSRFHLLQKAKNRAQTLRNLRIHTRGNNVGLTLNHHNSTSSSHGLITKPLSLLLPAFFLSFLHSVKLFTWLLPPHSVFQNFTLSYFPSLSSKNCQKWREIMS